ncbi:MAG: hypothetical protein RLZZ375_235 [Pseudomonadota bacterium]|jgi:L-lactate dehydrogenase complex protein LldG
MDTSAARAAIFQRIRQAQGRPEQVSDAERQQVQQYLAEPNPGPKPDIGSDLIGRFCQQAERTSQTIARVRQMSEVPAAVARYLDGQGISRQAIAWRTLQDLPWQENGIAVEYRKPVNEDMVGITGCFCAIAETGTLLLLSGPDTYSSAALLPETHIALLSVTRIVGAMEDAFALAKAERGELPRATNFISGPSRTGDIEQTIVLGAHGPYRVHVILIDA